MTAKNKQSWEMNHTNGSGGSRMKKKRKMKEGKKILTEALRVYNNNDNNNENNNDNTITTISAIARATTQTEVVKKTKTKGKKILTKATKALGKLLQQEKGIHSYDSAYKNVDHPNAELIEDFSDIDLCHYQHNIKRKYLLPLALGLELEAEEKEKSIDTTKSKKYQNEIDGNNKDDKANNSDDGNGNDAPVTKKRCVNNKTKVADPKSTNSEERKILTISEYPNEDYSVKRKDKGNNDQDASSSGDDQDDSDSSNDENKDDLGYNFDLANVVSTEYTCTPSDDDDDYYGEGNEEDDEDDDDEDTDLLIIDRGTMIANGDNTTTIYYGIVKDDLVDGTVRKWLVEIKRKNKKDGLIIEEGVVFLDDDQILITYNCFRHLSYKEREIGYAMFGLTEFDVILDNTEVLSFTYDIKINKTVVQSSKSHHVNISDILVAIGGENVFGVAFDKFVKILEQHKQRPISIKFRRKISVAANDNYPQQDVDDDDGDESNLKQLTEIVNQCKQSDMHIESSLGTFQGREAYTSSGKKGSTNGCVAIASLIVSKHISSNDRIHNNIIDEIIDNGCIHHLEELRKKEGNTNQDTSYIDSFTANEYFVELELLPPPELIEGVGGSIKQPADWKYLFDSLDGNPGQKIGGVFYYNEHYVAILKYPRSEIDIDDRYELIESLPSHNDDDDDDGYLSMPSNGARYECNSLQSFQSLLQLYCFKKRSPTTRFCAWIYKDDLGEARDASNHSHSIANIDVVVEVDNLKNASESESESDDNDNDDDDNDRDDYDNDDNVNQSTNKDGLSDYELLRLKNIQRNHDRFKKLGLDKFNALPPTQQTKKKKTNKKRKDVSMAPIIQTRSAKKRLAEFLIEAIATEGENNQDGQAQCAGNINDHLSFDFPQVGDDDTGGRRRRSTRSCVSYTEVDEDDVRNDYSDEEEIRQARKRVGNSISLKSKKQKRNIAASDDEEFKPAASSKKAKEKTSKEPKELSSDVNGGTIQRIRTPTPQDVLCGLGKGLYNHPGNKVFREWVRVRKDFYHRNYHEKTNVAKEIVRQVQDQNGRFLAKVASVDGGGYDHWWIEIDYTKALDKTRSCLRLGNQKNHMAHQLDNEDDDNDLDFDDNQANDNNNNDQVSGSSSSVEPHEAMGGTRVDPTLLTYEEAPVHELVPNFGVHDRVVEGFCLPPLGMILNEAADWIVDDGNNNDGVGFGGNNNKDGVGCSDVDGGSTPRRRIRTPTPQDVLCVHGTHKHPGTKVFREWVRLRCKDYSLACNHTVKWGLAEEVVRQVQQQNGRFLTKDTSVVGGSGGHCWLEINDKKALEKTYRALRRCRIKSRTAEDTDEEDEEVEEEEVEDEEYELIHVCSTEELEDDNPVICYKSKCNLVACSVWQSLETGNVRDYCIDCQRKDYLFDYDDWPLINKLPIDTITYQQRELMTEKCTKKNHQVPPLYPFLITHSLTFGSNIDDCEDDDAEGDGDDGDGDDDEDVASDEESIDYGSCALFLPFDINTNKLAVLTDNYEEGMDNTNIIMKRICIRTYFEQYNDERSLYDDDIEDDDSTVESESDDSEFDPTNRDDNFYCPSLGEDKKDDEEIRKLPTQYKTETEGRKPCRGHGLGGRWRGPRLIKTKTDKDGKIITNGNGQPIGENIQVLDSKQWEEILGVDEAELDSGDNRWTYSCFYEKKDHTKVYQNLINSGYHYKICTRCETAKPIVKYCKQNSNVDGLYTMCKECCNENSRMSYSGVSNLDYDFVKTIQDGKCMVCKQPETVSKLEYCLRWDKKSSRYKIITREVNIELAWDHNHITGALRSLCCSNCNPILERSVKWITPVKKYLDFHDKRNPNNKRYDCRGGGRGGGRGRYKHK